MDLSNDSPMRLGVSPAATSTPTGVFNQRLEVLFPRAGALGCAVCFAPPPFLLVYLCTNVGSWGSASCCTACPVRSTIRHVSGSGCVAESPVCPGCPSPPLLPVWMNVSFLSPWLSDFRVVRFSVSSGCFLFLNCCCPSFGCVKRRSVSTYASILVFSRMLVL